MRKRGAGEEGRYQRRFIVEDSAGGDDMMSSQQAAEVAEFLQ